jgi:hypothetical protein
MSATPNLRVVFPDEAPEASSLRSRRGVAILLLLSLVQFMDVLDASILNIGLPSIKNDLGFSQQSLLWSSTATSSPTAASCSSAAAWPICAEAPAAAVGEILATLGSADDRLWATNIRVATPVVFDRPLGVGPTAATDRFAIPWSSTDPDSTIVATRVPRACAAHPRAPRSPRVRDRLAARLEAWCP